MRNFVKTKDGRNAGNRYGSCGVLALAAIKGMRYEHATAWTIKQGMFDKIKNGEVAGMDIVKGGGFNTFKKLGAKNTTVFYRGEGVDGRTEDMKCGVLKGHLEKLGVQDVKHGRMKVETFAKRNPTGRHLLITRDHALACIHGEIYHNGGKWNFTNQLVAYSVQF